MLITARNKIDQAKKLNEVKTSSKPSFTISAAIIVVVIISAAMIFGIQSQTWHIALAQSAKSNTTTTTPATNTVVKVTPRQSTNKTFWISTVHLDGTTTIHPGVACNNCTQNTPPHPAEAFPNTNLPAGAGLVLRPPNKVGLGI